MALNRQRVFQVSAAIGEAGSYDSGGTIDERIAISQGDMPQEIVQVVDDSDLIGGTEEPVDQEVMAQHVTFGINIPRVKPFGLGFVLAYSLGSDVASAPDTSTPAATLKAHTCTPDTTDAGVMDTFSFEAWHTSSDKYKYDGAMFTGHRLGVQRGANRFVSLSADMIASGTRGSAGSAQTEPTETQLSAASSGAWFGTTGPGSGNEAFSSRSQDLDPATADIDTPTDITSILHSWEWVCDNGIVPDELYRIGEGNVLGDNDRNTRSQTLQVVFDYANDVYVAALKAQTEYSFQTIVRGDQHSTDTGYYYGFNLLFPQIKLIDVTLDERAGKLVWVTNWRVLDDAAGTYASVYCDVFNAFAAYGA